MTEPVGVLTIGEPGEEILGWVADGVQTLETMKASAEAHGGAPDTWPRHTMVEVAKARMECFGCGRPYGARHSKGCEHDNDDGEGWIWNWRAGDTVTILMADGRSVFDHFPHAAPDAAA